MAGTTAEPVPAETFAYNLQCTLLNAQVETTTNASQFVIPVTARQTFAAVQAVWNAASSDNCNGCHNLKVTQGSTTLYSAPPLGSVSYATLTTSNTSLAPICDTESTPVCYGTAATSTADEINFVDLPTSVSPPSLSSVPNSALLCWPQETCILTSTGKPNIHLGGQFLSPDLNMVIIRQWIEDGANNF